MYALVVNDSTDFIHIQTHLQYHVTYIFTPKSLYMYNVHVHVHVHVCVHIYMYNVLSVVTAVVQVAADSRGERVLTAGQA